MKIFSRIRRFAYILCAIVATQMHAVINGMALSAPDYNNPTYGIAQLQGKRPTMEDAHRIEIQQTHAFFGLFDGHGGRQVADYVAEHLYGNIINQPIFSNNIAAAMSEGYLQTDRQLEQAIGKSVARHQGATAVSLIIYDGVMHVANVGDSRAVLCRAGKAVPLSNDHKPNRPDEKNRIRRLGGHVVWLGCWRVNGQLALSRAIGDHDLAPYVIANPELRTHSISNDDEFVILACDGVWDVLSNQQAADIVRNSLANSRNFTTAAQNLIQRHLMPAAPITSQPLLLACPKFGAHNTRAQQFWQKAHSFVY